MYLDTTLHFHPSGETDYLIERDARIWIEHSITSPNIRVHTDETKSNEFSRYPHYQLVLPLENPEWIREFAEELKEAADKIEEGEYKDAENFDDVEKRDPRDVKESNGDGGE
jgi:hypothetical protein